MGNWNLLQKKGVELAGVGTGSLAAWVPVTTAGVVKTTVVCGRRLLDNEEVVAHITQHTTPIVITIGATTHRRNPATVTPTIRPTTLSVRDEYNKKIIMT